MEKENKEKEEEYSNIEEIRAEDTLEYLYEICDKWKDIKSMKEDLRKMIRFFKEEKFDRMQKEFRVYP